VITIELDTTDDPTHGAQQLSLFNGFHGTWCYRPLLGFIGFDKGPDQYLCLTMLRSGRAPDKCGVLFILGRLIPKLRKAFPKARNPSAARCRLRSARDPGLPRLGAAARIRGRDREKQASSGSRAAADGGGPEPIEGERGDRARLREVPVQGPEVASEASCRGQGRDHPLPRPRPPGQSPLRRHQHDEDAGVDLRARVLQSVGIRRTGSRS
jgi:hypothetical protein